MMGNVHGQMTVMVLIKLLEKHNRLPCPRDCPSEVKPTAKHSHTVFIISVSQMHLGKQTCLVFNRSTC